MTSALTRTRHPCRLAEVNAYGVQELTAAEAMATNGGALPLIGVIAAVVGADAAIMAGAAALLSFVAESAERE